LASSINDFPPSKGRPFSAAKRPEEGNFSLSHHHNLSAGDAQAGFAFSPLPASRHETAVFGQCLRTAYNGYQKKPSYRGLPVPTPLPGEDRKMFHPTTKAGYVRPARKNYNILKQ
jgi:hypothetical protein